MTIALRRLQTASRLLSKRRSVLEAAWLGDGNKGDAGAKMRISESFGLGKSQPYLDVVDIRLDTDIEQFLRSDRAQFVEIKTGAQGITFMQHYFEAVLRKMQAGDDLEAQELVSALRDRRALVN